MQKFIHWLILIPVLLISLSFFSSKEVLARPLSQTSITTPGQLIDVVNSLRLSHGLSALTVHSVLMQSSQSQADYMAATGQITHTRPGGITFTQQLLALGFPLAGDLSLGGFRAENILMDSNVLVWDGVPGAWQDAAHMNTMLSPNFTHIGAGISQGTNGYYYAVDCAATTGSGEMQDGTSSILTSAPAGSGQVGVSQYIIPVMMSTAQPNGDVIHKVQYGQSLWGIAIIYGTTIKNIQALNNLGDNLVVNQGQDLLVQKGATQPAPAVSTSTIIPPVTITPTVIPVTQTASISNSAIPDVLITNTPRQELPQANAPASRLLIGVLIIAAFVGGGVAVWLIREPN